MPIPMDRYLHGDILLTSSRHSYGLVKWIVMMIDEDDGMKPVWGRPNLESLGFGTGNFHTNGQSRRRLPFCFPI